MKRSLIIAGICMLLLVAVMAVALMTFLEPAGTTTSSRIIATSRPASPEVKKYTVTMSPMGTVTFTHIPQRIVTLDNNYNDMLVALRQQHNLVATGYANNQFDGFYRELNSADAIIDQKQIAFLSSGSGSMFDKETLYGLHADVHHIDPVQLAKSRGWSAADVQEIAHNVGPFFANRYSRSNDYSGPEKYEYYTVWDLSDKISQVYCRQSRMAKLKKVYDDMLSRIQAKLPPVNQRPRVGLVMYSKTGFLPYGMEKGFGAEQYRAVGAVDAFANVPNLVYRDGGGGTRLDLEGMLSIDPDVLITPFAVLPGMRSNHDQLLALRDDPLGQRLKAFRNNRIYPGGTPLQGPLVLLFQVEMAAKQIYPDQFGSYRDDQHYPRNEQLFDREVVTKILNDKAEDPHQ